MVDVIYNIILFSLRVRCTNDSDRFVESDVNKIFIFRFSDGFAIYEDFVLIGNFGSQFRNCTVDGDSAFFQQFIGRSSGAKANF